MNKSAVLLIVLFAVCAQAWQADLDALVGSAPGPERERLIGEIVKAAPDWSEIATHIRSIEFPPAETGTHLSTTLCIDDVERPWVMYVPEGYDPTVPTPLFVCLHGGVSRSDISDDPVGDVEGNEFRTLADDNGWLMLFPFGQAGATWFDEVGMANIDDLVRTVKGEFNVDDDRVWMGGFSDGASAAFLYAMAAPNDYAAFVALNGHMGVGSLDGDLPTYAPNFFNTPVYAVTTFDDGLYPSDRMRHTIEMAREAGGELFYREHEGGHDFTYAEEELPRISRFLQRHSRDPFPTRVVWEAANARFGECRWFALDRITTAEPADWHTDHNVALVSERITVGFFSNSEFEGPGMMVDSVLDDTFADRTGLAAGDVIIRADGMDIADRDDLNTWKTTVQRGDSVTITVQRGGGTLVLRGKLPEPANYYLFKRAYPSGLARASFSANRVDVEASRVGAFRILVHPDMFRLERNLVVTVDGETVFDALVEPDIEFMLRSFLDNRDRTLLYIAEVRIQLPS